MFKYAKQAEVGWFGNNPLPKACLTFGMMLLLKLPTCDTAKNVIEISALKAKTA